MTSSEAWVVTGGAGFLGSNLSATLLASRKRVVVLDNLATGLYSNVQRLAKMYGDRIRSVPGSILDRGALDESVRGASVVISLAAQVSVSYSVENPADTLMTNVSGFRCLLHACAEAGVRRIGFASSAAVYGDRTDLPLSEEAKPRPLSPFAESKVANEEDASMFAQRHPELIVAGFRFFNLYGPNQRSSEAYASVMPARMNEIANGVQPAVYGDGQQTRDLCHVVDATRAIIRFGTSDLPPGAHIYNIGAGHSVTLLELLNTMTELHFAMGHPALPRVSIPSDRATSVTRPVACKRPKMNSATYRPSIFPLD